MAAGKKFIPFEKGSKDKQGVKTLGAQKQLALGGGVKLKNGGKVKPQRG